MRPILKNIQHCIEVSICFHKTCFAAFLFSLFIFSDSFSQSLNDSIRTIFSSPAFSILEEYSGDWGSYSHTFNFTKHDTCEEVIWVDPEFPDGENSRQLKILLSRNEIIQLEKLFIGCQNKIQGSKEKSTEHSKYIFSNKEFAFTIDDKTTMLCVDDLKAWKENLFREGIMQEKRYKKN